MGALIRVVMMCSKVGQTSLVLLWKENGGGAKDGTMLQEAEKTEEFFSKFGK